MWRRTCFVLNGIAFLFVKDVLDLWCSGYFLFLALGFFIFSFENSKKTKRLNKDEIKKQLIDSIIINNAIEIDNLNELAEKVQRPEDAANIIKQYEEILRTKRIGIIFVAYYQGKLFELFKEKEKFIQMVSQWKIDKSTIIFQISIFKLI